MGKKTVIRASELHREAGKALRRVALGDEHLVVERDGYPIAVLMSYNDYEQYEQLRREQALAAHKELVRTLGQEAERQGVTEEQLMAELEEDKRAIFKEIYGDLEA
jgi:prevent-host-death family protein